MLRAVRAGYPRAGKKIQAKFHSATGVAPVWGASRGTRKGDDSQAGGDSPVGCHGAAIGSTLSDDYAYDGRVLIEALDDEASARSLRQHLATLSQLGASFKSINAPLGPLASRIPQLSTKALTGNDATYASITAKINAITQQRNAIAGAMLTMLENAEFSNQPINERDAQILIDEVQNLIFSAE